MSALLAGALLERILKRQVTCDFCSR